MEIRTLGTIALLIVVLFGSFLIRIQSSTNIPAGQLTDPMAIFTTGRHRSSQKTGNSRHAICAAGYPSAEI